MLEKKPPRTAAVVLVDSYAVLMIPIDFNMGMYHTWIGRYLRLAGEHRISTYIFY